MQSRNNTLLILLPGSKEEPPPRDRRALDRALLQELEQRTEQRREGAPMSLRRLTDLLNRGANPNARDTDGDTALMIAAGHEDAQAVDLLLRHGAKVNAVNKRGWTALMKAATYDLSDGDFGDFISQGDVSKSYPIVAIMTALLEHGADPNRADKDGMTALMLTAGYAQCPRCVHLLLQHGARVDARTKSRWSALTFALRCRDSGAERDNHEVIALLRQAGARE